MLPFYIRKQILKFLDSIGNERIWESETVKLLSITLNNDLKFDQHLNNVCLIVNRKLSTLSKRKKYLGFKRMGIFLKQFSNPNLNTALSHGCFTVEVQTIE